MFFKLKNMILDTKKYSLDCNYYLKEFNSLDDLINDIITSGMDPSYEITINELSTGELASDFIIE